MDEFQALWRANLEAGVLQLPRCSNCRAWNWYPLPTCIHCQGPQFAWEHVFPAGTLYSWTRVHRSFTRAEIALPYVVGLVELADAPGVRLPCRLADDTERLPIIGERVTMQAGRDDSDIFWTYASAKVR